MERIEKESAALSEAVITGIIDKLQQECRLDLQLPGGGYLHMSDELPYLVIYRKPSSGEDDKATMRFVLSEASFLVIANEDFEGYQRLMLALGDAMASKFKTFLLLEIYSGKEESQGFVIKGPAEKLPTTLKELKKELDLLTRKY